MHESTATRVRSWLFTPGTRPDRFDKAAALGADVSIIDLEDAVAPADKAAARRGYKSTARARQTGATQKGEALCQDIGR